MAIWKYLYLVKGRLIDSETFDEANINWPSFSSGREAEIYLEQNDIRASVTEELDSIIKTADQRLANIGYGSSEAL